MMRENKYDVSFGSIERGKMVNGINKMRNGLIFEGRDTGRVGGLLLKISTVPTKKIKVIYKQPECEGDHEPKEGGRFIGIGAQLQYG